MNQDQKKAQNRLQSIDVAEYNFDCIEMLVQTIDHVLTKIKYQDLFEFIRLSFTSIQARMNAMEIQIHDELKHCLYNPTESIISTNILSVANNLYSLPIEL